VARDRRRLAGRRGEDAAAALFTRLGFAVLERNHRTRDGEIDLIARRGGTLVFCEVKALVARAGRPAAGPAHPFEAVGRAKRSQVRRLARAWLAERDDGKGCRYHELRFDVVGVVLSPAGELLRLDHLEAAF
jgi:putative endonuclease